VTFCLQVPALDGRLVRLKPLAACHAADLGAAAEEDRSTFSFTTVPRASQVEESVCPSRKGPRRAAGTLRPDPQGGSMLVAQGILGWTKPGEL
jgi:hypothetical protein